ncbi:MAG TPA: VOC family protein [Chthoniobacteraceae bacterium]|nr:VOC family protein [Chthoniobacteraceae bacterium]
MSTDVKPIPEGHPSVIPSLPIRGAAKAIDFYQRAFGAEEVYRLDMPDGKIGHAEIRIGDSMIMLSDECPEWGSLSPESVGGAPTKICLYVSDADATFQKALDAGAEQVMAVADQFWGDRMGSVKDPFGYTWIVATHVEDVSHEEIARRFQEMLKEGKK